MGRSIGTSGRGLRVAVAAVKAMRGWRFLSDAVQPQLGRRFRDGSARPVLISLAVMCRSIGGVEPGYPTKPFFNPCEAVRK
jgi:hypothetical protein